MNQGNSGEQSNMGLFGNKTTPSGLFPFVGNQAPPSTTQQTSAAGLFGSTGF